MPDDAPDPAGLDPTTEQAYRAAEDALQQARDRGDETAVVSAEAHWADAAELWADDLERAGRPVPDGLRERVARFRQDTAAG